MTRICFSKLCQFFFPGKNQYFSFLTCLSEFLDYFAPFLAAAVSQIFEESRKLRTNKKIRERSIVLAGEKKLARKFVCSDGRCRLPESWIAKKIVLTTKELQV